jgi:glycosyltransferase involved in cell wall biosynthesis
VAGIADLITRLLNGELPLEEIGSRAHQKVTDLFNPEKMVELLLKAYFKLAESRPFWRSLAKSDGGARINLEGAS